MNRAVTCIESGSNQNCLISRSLCIKVHSIFKFKAGALTPRTTKILVVPAYSHWGLNPPIVVCKGEDYDEQAMNNIFTEYYSAYSLCKWAELREL